MSAYQEFVCLLFNDLAFLRAGALLGLPVSIILLVMFLRRKNRDERGWKIFGKASVISFLFFMVMVNVIAKTTGARSFPDERIGYLFFASVLQWLYDTVAAVEIIAVMVFRKLE